MVRDIVKDINFLKKKSLKATKNDIDIAKDLIDTLKFNNESCVGLAANMIGFNKNIIAFLSNNEINIMYNPKIIKTRDRYITKEGCLSLSGKRSTVRHKEITVLFLDDNFIKRKATFRDFTAEIIEHEIDHTLGIII